MQLKLICVGNIKEKYYVNSINSLRSNTNKNYNFEIIELFDEPIPNNPSDKVIEQIKTKEGNNILSKISKSDYVIALCIDGKSINNAQLKELINIKYSEGINVVMLIGGSLGLSDEVIERANYKLSFSKMTFPHQLMRVLLLEAIE